MGVRVIRHGSKIRVVHQKRPLQEVVWFDATKATLHEPGPADTSTPIGQTAADFLRPLPPLATGGRPGSNNAPSGSARRSWRKVGAALALVALVVGTALTTLGASVLLDAIFAMWEPPGNKDTPSVIVQVPTPVPTPSSVERKIAANVKRIQMRLANLERNAQDLRVIGRPIWVWRVQPPQAHRTATAEIHLSGTSMGAPRAAVRITNLRTEQTVHILLAATGGQFKGTLKVVWEKTPELPGVLAIQPTDNLLVEWLNSPEWTPAHVIVVHAEPHPSDGWRSYLGGAR